MLSPGFGNLLTALGASLYFAPLFPTGQIVGTVFVDGFQQSVSGLIIENADWHVLFQSVIETRRSSNYQGVTMPSVEPFVDIHCHLVPEIDDGAKSWDESLAMAEMMVADGFRTVIVTPHQLGSYAHNSGDLIRQKTAELQAELDDSQIPLEVLPGADVRIEDGMIAGLRSGSVVSLGDHRRHVLLELPHELYFPLEGILEELHRVGMVGILSHPERNQGLLKEPGLIEPLVDRGCLMQVTASSLIGGMGPGPQGMAEWMLANGLIHFLATDAHGPKSRRPLIARSFERVVELTDWETASDLCCRNPNAVADGQDVQGGRREIVTKKRGGISSWFSWRKAG